MTTGGWIFLLTSMIFVWGLCGWCFYKVMTGGKTTKPPDSLGG
jgi:hypothetical protein